MSEGKVYITEERIRRLEVGIDLLLYQVKKDLYSLVHVRVLASVFGQIISLQHVIGQKGSVNDQIYVQLYSDESQLECSGYCHRTYQNETEILARKCYLWLC